MKDQIEEAISKLVETDVSDLKEINDILERLQRLVFLFQTLENEGVIKNLEIAKIACRKARDLM